MATDDFLKNTLILRHDDHQFEAGDRLDISGATGFSTITESEINGRRTVVGVLNENYVLIGIAVDLPISSPDSKTNGGGKTVQLDPVVDTTIGYMFHYVPQLKMSAWSRFKTPMNLKFNCGCGTLEGRAFLFTPDGFMMRYGSPDHHVHADWWGMYDYADWESGTTYYEGVRIYDDLDGLVYVCMKTTTDTAPDFPTAREHDPDAWEEYKGEPIEFAWELPWSDFGGRQATKALRFVHIDANGSARFKLSLFADNIYKDAASGQFKPARELMFVPNEVGAFGSGDQVYGAGRRTREQKLWQMPIHCKLLKPRITGSSTGPLSISALSFLYQKGSLVRG
jgi:hypothetical protein